MTTTKQRKAYLRESEQTYCSLFHEIITLYGVHQFCQTMGIYARVFAAGTERTETDVERAVRGHLDRYDRLATITRLIEIHKKHPYKDRDATVPEWLYEQKQQRIQEVEERVKPELEGLRKNLEQVIKDEVFKVMEKR